MTNSPNHDFEHPNISLTQTNSSCWHHFSRNSPAAVTFPVVPGSAWKPTIIEQQRWAWDMWRSPVSVGSVYLGKAMDKNLGSKGKTMGKSLVPRVLPEFPVLGMNIHEHPNSFMRKNKKGQHFDPMADRWEAQSCLSTDITRGAGDWAIVGEWYPLVI